MCRRVVCAQCQKPSFAGCGMHIEQVLGDVAPSDRCVCREKKKETGSASASAGAPNLLRRLFGL